MKTVFAVAVVLLALPTHALALHTGDALAVRMGEIEAFDNTGGAPLELLIVGGN